MIDENGTQVGVVSLREALTMAEEHGFDLVEVAPTAVPPVCRIMDYGKFRYEQSKKEREARKNQRQVEVKQIRLEPKTDDHDLDVKAKQARRFLLDGDKVKFNLRFRGRAIYHPEIGQAILEQMAEALLDIAVIEQRPLMEGRVLSLTMAPSPKAKQNQQRRSTTEKTESETAAPQQARVAVPQSIAALPEAAQEEDEGEI